MITSINTNKDNNTVDGCYYYHDEIIKDAIYVKNANLDKYVLYVIK